MGIVGTGSGIFLKYKNKKFGYERNQPQCTNVPVNEEVTTELKLQVSSNVHKIFWYIHYNRTYFVVFFV